MNGKPLHKNSSSLFDTAQLNKLRLKAIRSGVWYRVLRRIDRVLFDLTIKITKIVRSDSLARSILEITQRIEDALESKLDRFTREFGFALARKLSIFAQTWGYKEALVWAKDVRFARYLAVMMLNG